MKHKILYGLLTVALFIFGFTVLTAFDRNDANKASESEFFVPAPYYHKEYSLDTLSNANNDTLTLPVTTYSNFEGNFQVVRTNISGTTNIALKVEQSNAATGNTDWVSVATGSGTGATTEAITMTSMLGLRYRFILDGTGTQSTSYRVHVTLKKKY